MLASAENPRQLVYFVLLHVLSERSHVLFVKNGMACKVLSYGIGDIKDYKLKKTAESTKNQEFAPFQKQIYLKLLSQNL